MRLSQSNGRAHRAHGKDRTRRTAAQRAGGPSRSRTPYTARPSRGDFRRGPTMSEPWCKGNYAHGNACGQCSRCKESLETIISESRRHKSERNALSVRALDLERRLTAALDDCETLRSAVAQLRKELDESRAKLRVMDDEYTKLAALRSDLAAELFEVLRKYGFVPYE